MSSILRKTHKHLMGLKVYLWLNKRLSRLMLTDPLIWSWLFLDSTASGELMVSVTVIQPLIWASQTHSSRLLNVFRLLPWSAGSDHTLKMFTTLIVPQEELFSNAFLLWFVQNWKKRGALKFNWLENLVVLFFVAWQFAANALNSGDF